MLPLSPITVGFMRMGQWGLNRAALRDWIGTVLDLGITSFDHADVYGDYGVEEAFGDALALQPAHRDRMQLISKVGVQRVSPGNPGVWHMHYDLSGAHILATVEASLRKLRTDRLDLLLLHRPDPLMRAEEVAEAFDRLQAAGKVLHFGVSNFPASRVRALQRVLAQPLLVNQVEISLERPDAVWDGTLDSCQELGLTPMAWSPLGGGGLFRDDPARAGLRQALREVADAYGAAPDQIALAWLLAHPAGIRCVVGTGRLDRLRGAVGAQSIQLDRQNWYKLLAAAEGKPVP